jgi:hypothetical protein
VGFYRWWQDGVGLFCTEGGFLFRLFGFPPRRRFATSFGVRFLSGHNHTLSCGGGRWRGGCGIWMLEVVFLFRRC